MKKGTGEDTLMYPPLEELQEHIPQKYELVLAATRRAKQIIREFRLNPVNAELTYGNRKPLSIALTEIMSGKLDMTELLRPDFDFDQPGDEQDMFADMPMRQFDVTDGEGELILQDGEVEKDEDDDLDIDMSDVDSLNWDVKDDK